ncbi:hypothetical protein CEXT_449671 [Caerostris extrusa]|uniref:Uncharacterized protein n=1 Tax=Caerostris extrusa TaxID=172846 RepID=A0AAV4Y489_CAEEX|nr:hypothetical protein CEXT_449671 [Caerostris extrusa]
MSSDHTQSDSRISLSSYEDAPTPGKPNQKDNSNRHTRNLRQLFFKAICCHPYPLQGYTRVYLSGHFMWFKSLEEKW